MDASGKILMVVASRGFRDEEYLKPREVFEKDGLKVVVASSVSGMIRGALGTWIKSDEIISKVRPREFDAVVFVGGNGAQEYLNDRIAHRICRESVENGKVLGAICIAPSILANAGVLYGRRATCYVSEKENLIRKGAIYTEEKVVEDDLIITASGPDVATQFGERVLAKIKRKKQQ